MKAIVFRSKGRVAFTDRPDPVPADDEVIIEVKASGICHTDFEVLKDNYGTGAFPVIAGHEYAGVVKDMGAKVQNIQIGDRVVVDPNLECGSCKACVRGWAHLCERLEAYGVTRDGGFGELSVVRAARVHLIGDITFARAALAEPMGCALNGLDAVFTPWMETALIFGAGPMGILLGLALKHEGIPEISFCDIDRDRIALASSMGFHAFENDPTQLSKYDQRMDLVVDATGAPQIASQLPIFIRNGGRGLFFGVCPSDARISISPFEMFRRQITLSGSHSLNHNIPRSMAIIEKLGPVLDPIISHKLPLKDIAHFLSKGPPAGSLKIQWHA